MPQFEKASGHTVTTTWAGTVDVMKRMAAGEVYDLVMISVPQIDELIQQGKVANGSRVDIAKSGIGVAVKAGAPKPDLSSARGAQAHAARRQDRRLHQRAERRVHGALLRAARHRGRGQGEARGVPSGGTIGTIVASGECEIGFQQVSELVHIKGIDYVGPLPPDVQRVTIFSSGVHAAAQSPDGAKALQAFLTTPSSAAVMRKHGSGNVLISARSAPRPSRPIRHRARRLRAALGLPVPVAGVAEIALDAMQIGVHPGGVASDARP